MTRSSPLDPIAVVTADYPVNVETVLPKHAFAVIGRVTLATVNTLGGMRTGVPIWSRSHGRGSVGIALTARR